MPQLRGLDQDTLLRVEEQAEEQVDMAVEEQVEEQVDMAVGIHPVTVMIESARPSILMVHQISPAGLEIWVSMVAGVKVTIENARLAPTTLHLLVLTPVSVARGNIL